MLHKRVNATLEIAVAGQDAGANNVAARYRVRDLGLQWTGVADAGRAAVADRVEADLLQIVDELGFFEVVGDDARARCQAGLDPGFGFQAFRRCVARDQARRDHDGRIRRIRAAGYGRNQNRAVVDRRRPGRRDSHCRCRLFRRLATVSARIFS